MLRPTPANPTGPAWRRGAPFRHDLTEGARRGKPLRVSGTVRFTDGTPGQGLVLDVWHAGPHGLYSVLGMRWRGRQEIGADGRWEVRTVVPGGYLWRPPHVHLKVWQGDRVLLTTQLYLAGHRRLRLDPHVRPELIRPLEPEEGGFRMRFDLVVLR